MRTQEEIEDVASELANRPEILHSMGNSFKYGYLVGKMTALGWVLGASSEDMSIDYDFEDWWRELHEAGEEMRRRLLGGDETK
jgi:hypothetical protein